ncbi:MAG: hypothetical protein ACLQVG_03630 [Terriglobia bacterium]
MSNERKHHTPEKNVAIRRRHSDEAEEEGRGTDRAEGRARDPKKGLAEI